MKRQPKGLTSVRGIFQRAIASEGPRPRRRRDRPIAASHRHETLESRLAFAVSVFSPPFEAGNDNWVTVAIDQGSDAYVQQSTNASRDLLIADNASFTNRRAIAGFSQYDELRVYEGSLVQATGLRPANYPYVQNTAGQYGDTLLFGIPYTIVNPEFEIQGTISLPDGRSLDFTNGGRGTNFTITSGAGGVINGVLAQGLGYGSSLRLTSQAFTGLAGLNGTPLLRVQFANQSGTPNSPSQAIASGIPAVAEGGGTSQIEVADLGLNGVTGIERTYVPGSLSGEVAVEVMGVSFALPFQAEDASSSTSVPLSFRAGRDNFVDLTVPYREARFGTIADSARDNPGGIGTVATILRVSGEFNADTGVLTISTTPGYAGTIATGGIGGGFQVVFSPLGFEYVLSPQVSASLGVYTPSPNAQPPSFSLSPGAEHVVGLVVELPTPGANVKIQSPVLAGGSGSRGQVTLAASLVTIDAPILASAGFAIPSEQDSQLNTITEQVTVNAATSSNVFVVEIADDPRTTAVTRSRLVVGQSGSFSARPDVLNPATGPLPPSDRVFVSVEDGDIYIEGQVVADEHSYRMASGLGSEAKAPYTFATESRITGVGTGKIIGDTVAVSLSNDTFGVAYDSIAESRVALNTEIDRLRVQAGSRLGDPLNAPFPYSISINEDDSLIIDAVAGSSGPMEFKTGAALNLLAAIRSAGDVMVNAGSDFTVRAPIYTSFGAIELSAPQIFVDSAIRILDGIQDERNVDISLVARSGELQLNDAIVALNRVSLSASGAGARVTGNARITADVIDVVSDGGVDLRTATNLIAVETNQPVRLDELDAAVFEIRGSDFVTLIANGADTATPNGLSPALYADVYDTERLVVSAPRGSVDVLHSGAGTLAVGDLASINNGSNDVMVAAGSVVIRSNLARQMDVQDAPAPTSGAIEVRTTTTVPLNDSMSTYDPGVPGTFPTYLTTRFSLGADRKVTDLGGLEVGSIRAGDRVLVKDGMTGSVHDIVNGIYTVLRVQFPTANEVDLTLARASAYDETKELENRHYVRVTDGNFRGAVYVADGFDNSDPSQASPTPIVVTPVLSQPGYVAARASTTEALTVAAVQFAPAAGGRITAQTAGSIAASRSLFDGVVVAAGDLVLVRDGALDGNGNGIPSSPGIYQVTNAGGSNVPWVLTRYGGIDEDGDGIQDPVYQGIVAINEGSLRTANTGEMYRVGYESIHAAPLAYRQLGDYRQGIDMTAASRPAFDSLAQFRLDVGSDNPNGFVNFVVSTEGGTNNATGSLGKVLNLLQSNTAFVNRINRPQAYELTVGRGVENIVLEQALPVIATPLEIFSDRGLTIDGSRIILTRDGAIVRGGSTVARIGPIRPGEVTTARKLVRTAGPASVTEVHGIEVASTGSGAVIRNVTLGGFRSGAAVQIVGAANVRLENVVTGQDGNGQRSVNKVGVSIVGDADYTTLINSRILASTDVGVAFDAGADNARVVGTVIGAAGQGNAVGVRVASGDGKILLGAAPVLPGDVIVGLPMTPVNSSVVTVPKNSATDILQPGHQFYERATNRLWTIVSIELVATDPTKYRIALSGPPVQAAAGATSIAVEAGYFVNALARQQQITLPAGVSRDDLYLGQFLTGTVEGIIETETRIQSITPGVNGTTTIVLDRPVVVSGMTGLLFGPPERNRLDSNGDGIVLTSGEARVVGTDVTSSVFDGIRIEGIKTGGHHVIGGVDGRQLSTANVAVNANGLSGIRFAEAFFAGLGTDAQKRDRMAQVAIWGNFLGTDITSAPGLANGMDGASNVVIEDVGMQQEFVMKSTRDASGRYAAEYRPEDDKANTALRLFSDRDRADNFHFTGDPVIVNPGSGGGFSGGATGGAVYGDGGLVRLPTRR